MILGSASKALTGMRHQAVQVTIAATNSGYLVSAEETCTSVEELGVKHVVPVKTATEEFSTLESLLEKEDAVFGGFASLGEEEGICQELLADAFRNAIDRLSDLFLFHGAAHIEDSGAFIIDWEDNACRELIKT